MGGFVSWCLCWFPLLALVSAAHQKMQLTLPILAQDTLAQDIVILFVSAQCSAHFFFEGLRIFKCEQRVIFRKSICFFFKLEEVLVSWMIYETAKDRHKWKNTTVFINCWLFSEISFCFLKQIVPWFRDLHDMQSEKCHQHLCNIILVLLVPFVFFIAFGVSITAPVLLFLQCYD